MVSLALALDMEMALLSEVKRWLDEILATKCEVY